MFQSQSHNLFLHSLSMTRQISQDWSAGDSIEAARLQNVNQELDNIYENGSDRLAVRATTWLWFEVWKWTYKVWSTEWIFLGDTWTVSDNTVSYIMIDATGSIQVETSWRDSDFARLAKITSSWWNITDIENRKNDVVWWPLWETAKTVSAFIAGENITNWQALYISDWSWWRISWRTYLASADNSTYIDSTNFVWFATQTVTSWNWIKIDTSGVNSTQSLLTTWIKYYLSNTAWTISTTPWNRTVCVWFALSSSQLLIDVNGSNSGWNIKNIWIVGENISSWNCLSLHFHPSSWTFTIQRAGAVAAWTRQSGVIIWNWVSITQIALRMLKQWTITDNAILRIETDDWTWKPSWTLIHANAEVIVSGALFPTTAAAYTFTFPGAFTIPNMQKCHVVMSRSGALDNVNRFWFHTIAQSNSSIFNGASYNWTIWTVYTTSSLYIVSNWNQKSIIWKSNSTWKDRFLWFANNSALYWQYVEYISDWVFDKLSWLTVWVPYFMSSAVSWTIGTTTGAWTLFRLWVATSPTSLFIWPQLSSYTV